MSGTQTHDVAVELTDAVDSHWFAEEFAVGERIALSLGGETAVATVVGVEPADGVIVVDLTAFDRDDLGGSVTLPDMSSTGERATNFGLLWSIAAVPVESGVARDDSVDRVICECGAVCQAGRGHTVHQAHTGQSAEPGVVGQ